MQRDEVRTGCPAVIDEAEIVAGNARQVVLALIAAADERAHSDPA